jgi:16S rRNA G966 N2-methylase RsmD
LIIKFFLKNNKKKFDIIFADPPYDFSIKQYLEITELIKTNEILSDTGELIIEHRSNIKISEKFKNIDERKYGSSVLSFMKKASL